MPKVCQECESTCYRQLHIRVVVCGLSVSCHGHLYSRGSTAAADYGVGGCQSILYFTGWPLSLKDSFKFLVANTNQYSTSFNVHIYCQYIGGQVHTH